MRHRGGRSPQGAVRTRAALDKFRRRTNQVVRRRVQNSCLRGVYGMMRCRPPRRSSSATSTPKPYVAVLSSSARASPRFLTTCAVTSSSSTSAASAVVPSTSATASVPTSRPASLSRGVPNASAGRIGRARIGLAALSSPVDSGGGVEWWVLEHAGPVLDQLDAAVEGAAARSSRGRRRGTRRRCVLLPWRR